MTEQDREREKQKRRLRSRMLVTETGREDYRGDSTEATQQSNEPDDDESRLFRHRVKKLLLVILPIAVLIGAAGWFYCRWQAKQYTEYQVVWEKDLAADSFSSFIAYGDNLLKYSQDGASYINKTGEVVWSQAYEMRSPMVAVSGYYVAIADREGRSIYICDQNGCQGIVNTTRSVTNIAIAGQGMVAAVLEEGDVSYIDFFDKTGSRLDIEKKMWMGGEGYPIAIALSPTGTQLMLSCVYADAGTMQNKIAFFNFSEVGELLNERLAGAFEIGGTVAVQVAFLSDTRACAFLDNGVIFYSMEQLSSKEPLLPEQGESHTYEAEIRSVFYGDGYVGVVTQGVNEKEPYHMYLYNASGTQVLEMGFDFDYTKIQVSEKGLCLYNDSQCRLYSLSGRLKYSGDLGSTIRIVVPLSSGRVICAGEQSMAEIALR